jgi:hypothetical protein
VKVAKRSYRFSTQSIFIVKKGKLIVQTKKKYSHFLQLAESLPCLISFDSECAAAQFSF